MPFNTIRQPSGSSFLSIVYITVGVLASIWSAVWFFFIQRRETPPADWQYYVCAGLFLSGLAVAVIGFLVGKIGWSARKADSPEPIVTAPVAAVPTANAPVAAPAVGQPVAAPAPAPALSQPVARV